MTVDIRTEKPSDRELVLACTFDAPPEMVYRAWTEPALLKRWFAPRPYETPVAELDVRAGGASRIVMRGPDGQEYPCPGVYLEVVENRRLIMTDAYTAAWEPAAKPFMTTILSFEKDGGRTRYTARVLHWSAEDCDAHERMGFHEGWSQAARQLAEVVATL
ncbi:activator of HSP90 ATPase [Thalassobaculum fulvum]|uniref:Activator of HSP90 ATPase n=1 Tax=Thalassobaculum fulvum TaxID=1633335 RepID=A0A918XP17_9PROT|nr:SRPBCC family protein [Thalassobaculum fulvum]GHD42743.1 activator of HSP90 ATPase [Thalassobaculum fulvum]